MKQLRLWKVTALTKKDIHGLAPHLLLVLAEDEYAAERGVFFTHSGYDVIEDIIEIQGPFYDGQVLGRWF